MKFKNILKKKGKTQSKAEIEQSGSAETIC